MTGDLIFCGTSPTTISNFSLSKSLVLLFNSLSFSVENFPIDLGGIGDGDIKTTDTVSNDTITVIAHKKLVISHFRRDDILL